MKHKTILFIIMLLQLIFLKAAEHSQKDCMVLANQMNNINVTLNEIKQSIQACECCKSILFFVLCHFIAKWGCILGTEKQLETFCIENAIDPDKEFSKINQLNEEEIVSLNRKFMPKETLLYQALKSLSKNHLKNNYMKKIKKRIKKLLNLGANPSSLLWAFNKKWCLILNKIKLQEIFFQLLIHQDFRINHTKI